MASRGRHGSMNFVALQCARCCGLRVAFASDRPSILFPLRRARRCGLRVVFIASDNPSISFALPCCIRLPKTFVALQCMIFFSIGLLVSYRFMFFFIDWKLPPPACPGTTGIFTCKNRPHIVQGLKSTIGKNKLYELSVLG